jgi:hypothetical protein
MRKPLTTALAHVGAFVAVLATGCDVDQASAVESDLGGGAQGVPYGHYDQPDSLAISPAHPAAIHILLDDAFIRPWCGGVLVAPDVVVTAANCAAGVSASRLEIGTMIPGVHGEHAVEQVAPLARDPRLVALVLEEPVEGVEPASIARLEDDECGVQSVSYLYVAGPDAPLSRWVWSGCYTAETHAVEPVRGEPNCHGDSGAPVFDEDGDMIGVVVAASGHDVCIDELTLAGPESGAYDEALELSR